MSFSYKVKDEIIKNKYKPCCSFALLYGALLYAKVFSLKKIMFVCENIEITIFVSVLIKELCEVDVNITEQAGAYKIIIDNENDIEVILNSIKENTKIGEKIEFENECCLNSFISGAFLSCGRISDPYNSYMLEFELSNRDNVEQLAGILKTIGYEAKYVTRKNKHVLYYKDSACIEELLTLMGAPISAMDIMNVKIYKEFRNEANRLTNCETANISKTIEAGINQKIIIEKLMKENKLSDLPNQYIEIAELRVKNPEMSYLELGKMLKPPLTKSGVSHRMKKILSLNEDNEK